MNDLVRGLVVAGACVALYLSMRLAFVSFGAWRKNRHARRHAVHHVLLMNVALSITTVFIIVRLVVESGTNAPLIGWDVARGAQVTFLIAGLKPMWQQHRRTSLRRENETTNEGR